MLMAFLKMLSLNETNHSMHTACSDMASPHACPAYGSADLEHATKIESVEVCLLCMLQNISCLDSKVRQQAQAESTDSKYRNQMEQGGTWKGRTSIWLEQGICKHL